ncbi:MAG: hypothetical protein RLZZ28_1430 [Bacteroidota bacterium]
MHPKELSIADFTYDLPEERIARFPLPERDQSKLLIYRQGTISESFYYSLAEEIPANSLLVFNNTRVVEARLLFEKENGSKIEIFCLEPADQYADITSAMLQKNRVWWKCLVGGAKKWKEAPLLARFKKNDATDLALTATKIEQHRDYFLIELSWNDAALSFADVLSIAGTIPLPPYLNRAAEEEDTVRYQTIYAKYDGSVAAPTAGLHFTESLLEKLLAQNIAREYLTLHVGAGTFKPVKSNTMQGHEMHAEFIEVPKTFLTALMEKKSEKIIAVGTTSARTLETLYWLGIKTIQNPAIKPEALLLTQWEPYELTTEGLSTIAAMKALVEWMDRHQINTLITKTQIIIAPGYTFKIIDGLITNFHQPQSTLLLLVAAITGTDWKKIYRYALENEYRFLSYGDGSLLWV